MKELFWNNAQHALGFAGLVVVVFLYGLSSYIKGGFLWIIGFGIAIMLGMAIGYLLKDFRRSACTDVLTGLWNRAYFDHRLAEEMERAQRSNSSLAIALIDIDNFKEINDRYGHSSGDKALIEIANLIRLHTRAFDIVSRWGGDEFAVILPDTNSVQAAMVSERLRTAAQQRVCAFHVTLSIGVLPIKEITDVSAAIEMVDQALSKSKGQKNMITVWESSISLLSR